MSMHLRSLNYGVKKVDNVDKLDDVVEDVMVDDVVEDVVVDDVVEDVVDDELLEDEE